MENPATRWRPALFEILLLIVGIGLLAAGVAWRIIVERTGIPAMRACLADPDPSIRSAAIDRIRGPIGDHASALLELARRDTAPEVREAITRLAARNQWEPNDTPALADLRSMVAEWLQNADPEPIGGSRSTTVTNQDPKVDGSLLAAVEGAVPYEVVALRLRSAAGTMVLKSPGGETSARDFQPGHPHSQSSEGARRERRNDVA